MSLALNQSLGTAVGCPQPVSAEAPFSSLNISVIFTSVGATVAALKRAVALARSLGARESRWSFRKLCRIRCR